MSSSIQSVFSKPDIALNIFSFLENEDLANVALTSSKLNPWKARTEIEFGIHVANGAKLSNQSWKETYGALKASREIRKRELNRVIKIFKEKMTRDLYYRKALKCVTGSLPKTTHFIPKRRNSELQITVYTTYDPYPTKK